MLGSNDWTGITEIVTCDDGMGNGKSLKSTFVHFSMSVGSICNSNSRRTVEYVYKEKNSFLALYHLCSKTLCVADNISLNKLEN